MARSNSSDDFMTAPAPRPQDDHTQADFAPDEWMTLEQVAEHFGVPAARVRQWIADGLLNTDYAGSVERVRRSELDHVGNPEAAAAARFEEEHAS